MLSLGVAAAAQQEQQAGSIRGVVHDKDFGAPLANAQVTVVETGQKVATAEQGNFVLGQVPPGKYTLVFSKDGYVRHVKGDVVVAAGRLTDVDVSLTGDFTEMEEFVVHDTLRLNTGSEAALLQLRLESPALMDSISAELISRAGASDAASALKLVAGASVQDGKSAVIRGLPDRYVSSQMNGVRLPTADENKRAVELDQFPAVVIESLQVSKTFTPDQQGDASGGAVDVRLRGIPQAPFFFNVKAETSLNSQVAGRSNFLTYDGGGVSFWGRDNGARALRAHPAGTVLAPDSPSSENVASSWEGAVGVSRADAPLDYKWSAATGGKQELIDGVKVGGFASLFYERDSSFYENGIDDAYWVESPGAKMTPRSFQGTVQQGDFKTGLFDVTRAQQSVQWGVLGTLGLETEHHALSLLYLYTRTAEDTATLAEDTRGKAYYFPKYDPHDPRTPGHESPDAAPYLRLETLDYVERTTGTLQLHGRHTLPIGHFSIFHDPEVDWTVARSSAMAYEPDKRQFGTVWYPGRTVGRFFIPPLQRPFKPAANFTLGNLQRIWKRIAEDSEQYALNLKLPFEQWSAEKGYGKVGFFKDRVKRSFDQNTFSNFNDNSSFEGDFSNFWSKSFPSEKHPITDSLADVDYKGNQEITAYYAMVDLPLLHSLHAIAGARVESTRIGIVNDPEAEATWFPPGSVAPTKLNPGDADVTFSHHDVLPSIALEFKPFDQVTLRGSYNETVARQTFKELSPILQQEFLGGPIFIGNPELKMSGLRNYDLRVDYVPYEGALLSASWFKKDIAKPIEHEQRIAAFDFTTAVNYPKGELNGYELEVRQRLGELCAPLKGLAVGANATFVKARVTLPDDEAAMFEQPNIKAPMRTRDMSNAPSHLYNAFVTYDLEDTGTQLALFYTVQGDTLLAGAAVAEGNFVPNVYAKEFDTLNVSLAQQIGKYVKLTLQAKNLTNPKIQEVYRSSQIGADVVRSSHTNGIEYVLTLGAELKF